MCEMQLNQGLEANINAYRKEENFKSGDVNVYPEKLEKEQQIKFKVSKEKKW